MKNKVIKSGEQAKVKSYWGTYTVLFFALGAMTFFGVCDPQSGSNSVSGNAAVVGSETISLAEFRRAYQQTTEQLRNQYRDNYDPAIQRPAASALRQLVNDRVLYLLAGELGIYATEDEVVKYLVELKAFQSEDGKFSQENYKSWLRYYNHSEESFLAEMTRNLTVQKLREFVTTSTFASKKAAEIEYRIRETRLDLEYIELAPDGVTVNITEDEVSKFASAEDKLAEIKEWYDSHASDYKQPEKVKARHILVTYKGARGASGDGAKRSKEEAKARADKILAQVQAAGADFVAVAKKETDEPSGKGSGGDLGFFTREAMVKQFSDAAFALKSGEIAGAPVESPFGFHVIKVEGRKEKKEVSLEDAKQEIARKLIGKSKKPEVLKARADRVLAELQAGKDAKDLLSEYGVAWKKTGNFSPEARSIPGLGNAENIIQKLTPLTKAAPLLGEVLDVGNKKFVVRLVERTDPDLSKVKKEEIDQLTQGLKFTEGYRLLTSLEQAHKKKLEELKQIKMNAEFLALDVQGKEQ